MERVPSPVGERETIQILNQYSVLKNSTGFCTNLK
jgi:hypothetical protein